MKKEWRIPTIIGIIIIGLSLAATVFLFRNARNFFGQATGDVTPQEVKITNISESGFSVSWTTSGNATGTLNFGEESSLGNITIDDRDQVSGKTDQYPTHHVTLRYLKPSTQYYFKIISGGTSFDNNGQNYIVSTAPQISPSSSQTQPAYGTVLKADGTPAAGAIVYLSLANSMTLSTLVKSSGNWLITLNNARTANLGSFLSPKGTDRIEIFIQGAGETSRVLTTVSNDAPVPQITLGKTYDFAGGAAAPAASPSVAPSSSPSSNPKFSLPAVATPSPSLSSPATDAAIPSDRPVFKGTGVPGQIVTIKVESGTPLTGTTNVDQSGNWTWTPPTGLTPGEHTVTITTKDSSGKLALVTRKFTVLASGTQVTEPATPSASPRVSPSPSLRPSPSLSPSPTATLSPAPTSGNFTPTLLLIILGLTLMALGTGRILLLDR